VSVFITLDFPIVALFRYLFPPYGYPIPVGGGGAENGSIV